MKQDLINSLKKDISLLIEKHSNEIAKDNFGQALNIMKDIDATLYQLKIITDINEEFDLNKKDNIKNGWYDILKFFVETKQPQLIQLDYTNKENVIKHRGTGKTTALLRLSNDYNLPILVKNFEREHNELDKLSKSIGLHIIVVDLKMLNMVQYRTHDVLLVDENTKFDFTNDNLRGYENKLDSKILIGFKNNL